VEHRLFLSTHPERNHLGCVLQGKSCQNRDFFLFLEKKRIFSSNFQMAERLDRKRVQQSDHQADPETKKRIQAKKVKTIKRVAATKKGQALYDPGAGD